MPRALWLKCRTVEISCKKCLLCMPFEGQCLFRIASLVSPLPQLQHCDTPQAWLSVHLQSLALCQILRQAFFEIRHPDIPEHGASWPLQMLWQFSFQILKIVVFQSKKCYFFPCSLLIISFKPFWVSLQIGRYPLGSLKPYGPRYHSPCLGVEQLQGFYCNMFTVPKPKGGTHCILELKSLECI